MSQWDYDNERFEMSDDYTDYTDWQPPKPSAKPLPKQFIAPVRGVKAMSIDLSDVCRGDVCELRREPDNPVDPNAVQVFHKIEWENVEPSFIGYLPASLAQRMDDPQKWEAVVIQVLTHEDINTGVRLRVTRRREST